MTPALSFSVTPVDTQVEQKVVPTNPSQITDHEQMVF